MESAGEPQFGHPAAGVRIRERPGAYAVIAVDNHVLVVETPAGLYLPGGGIEKEETAAATLRREVREETGFDVVAATHLCSARQYVGSGINKIETFFTVAVSGEIRQGELDHRPRWLPIDVATAKMAEEAQAWAIRRSRS
jgi:8-oxo-dGTP diphosphatase